MGNEGKRNKRIGETEKKRDRERGREREGERTDVCGRLEVFSRVDYGCRAA